MRQGLRGAYTLGLVVALVVAVLTSLFSPVLPWWLTFVIAYGLGTAAFLSGRTVARLLDPERADVPGRQRVPPPLAYPSWVVTEPYSLRSRCWGCGLAPDFKRDRAYERRIAMCRWCFRLYATFLRNQAIVADGTPERAEKVLKHNYEHQIRRWGW